MKHIALLIAAVSLSVLGLSGLYLGVPYSGYVLGVGLLCSITLSDI